MDNMDSITALVGWVGCIYNKRNISPPFGLRTSAVRWLSDGIPAAHVAECIERHLNENHGQYHSGSGDGRLPLVDREIRESWRQLQRPPRARPARTDRLYKRSTVFDNSDEWFIDCSDPARRTAPPVDLKTIDKAELGGERWDVPRRHPDQVSALPTAAPHRPHAAPSHATRLRPVDRAVAFLREELAHGEVAVAEVEANAKYEGISLRTLDRARTRLKVVSRRRGFGKVGGFWLSLPPPVPAAKDATKSRGEQG